VAAAVAEAGQVDGGVAAHPGEDSPEARATREGAA